MNERRGNLYLLTGLIIGIVLGLLYAWVISPVKYTDTQPALLSAVEKDQYRQVIALAYQSDHDLGRARQRIELVDPGGSVQLLAAQAQRMVAENTNSQEARALALLAADLSGSPAKGTSPAQSSPEAAKVTQESPQQATLPPATETPEAIAAVQTPTLPPSTPTVSPTPLPTFTPRPTATQMRILNAPFVLKDKKEVCGVDATPGLLQIEVVDEKGNPIPSVRIEVTWQDGANTLFTGLAPEISPGYADIVLKPGSLYSLKVGEASKLVESITIPSCGGGWKFEFQEGG